MFHNNFFPDRWFRWTAAVLFLMTLSLVLNSTSQAKDEIATIRKLTGKVPDSTLLSKRPPAGVVVDQASWKSLWTAWRANDAIVNVDFQNQIVLVATADGPNVVLTSSLNLTPSGDLRYEVASTKMAGPGFGYALLIVPRNRIKSVNGQKLPASTKPKPAMLPPMTMPPESEDKTENAAESIRVEIQGRVRTGVMSRAKSTGIMVVANGIVWELDLQNDPQLLQAAQQLGTSVGSIRGTLSKISSPNRSFRWVVDVETIGPISKGQTEKPVNGELVRSNVPKSQLPKTPVPTSSAIPNTPMVAPADSRSVEPAIAAGSPEAPSSVPVSQQTGFRSIIVSATGGRSALERKQTVAANGSVTLEVPKTNYSESFSLDSSSLLELHSFVANTDWKSVPRSTGSVSKDSTNFSITVETKNGTKRFFIDGASIKTQPVINRLFGLMRKPATDK